MTGASVCSFAFPASVIRFPDNNTLILFEGISLSLSQFLLLGEVNLFPGSNVGTGHGSGRSSPQ